MAKTLRDDPGARKDVMKRGAEYPEKVMDSSKVTFSVMFTGNAEGDVLPPYVVYKCVHLYDLLVPDTINPKVAGLMKPHSQNGFSK